MQNHSGGLTSSGRRHAGIALLMVCAVFAVSTCNPAVVSITVNPDGIFAAAPPLVPITVNRDGTFTPSVVNIQAGQTIQWVNLSSTDSIVQIGDPTAVAKSDQGPWKISFKSSKGSAE